MSKLAHLSVLHKVWFASITALVLLLAINAMQSYQAITELKDQEISSGTTKAKLRSAKEVFSSVQDAELHLLAYLISHKQHHLDLYFKSLERLDEHVSELKQLSYQLPQQTLDIQTLEQAILTRLDEMREDINPGNKKLNLERVLNSKVFTSQDSLSAIRSLLQEIESSEYALLDQQSLEAMSSRERLMATTTLATVLSLILVVLIAVLLYRAISKQQLEALHLEALVEQRTREIQVYSDELKRSNRELQDFAFVASHDLQEPLRKIRTFGDRLSSRYADKLGEGGIDYIARMQNAAQRMSTLIENLLAFSRVTTRAKEFESVDLNLL
ncbi:MAG: CHASE3 domain-containing protein, partial [Pseudomonadales bacterium]|nr:CHASE3 domain-containing protein [Pseudomonadales bacterium]